jgi:hypothetical protein
MQSVNSSNFTYTEAPIRATTVTHPYASMAPGSLNQPNIPTSSAHYSLMQPTTLQTGAQTTYLSPQPRVVTNQSMEPLRVRIF